MITFLGYLPIILCAAILFFFAYKRSKFKNRSLGGAFFFENDCLVLNTGLPYPVPLNEIKRVELRYSQWELDHRLSYSLWVWVVRQNGRTKKVYYKGYRTAKLALPSDMKVALEEKGVQVVMIHR